MHSINIAPDIAARALASRGGRESLFPDLDPSRTAHVVIDMQNGFLEPGALIEVASAREIIPAINSISHAIRDAGGVNIFVQFMVDRRSVETWSTFFGKVFTPEIAEAMMHTFAAGSHGHALYPDLDVEPADLRVDKTRFGAFVPGTSDLEKVLQDRRIETLIITGTATNVCCETTAREAMQRNYRVIFVADATAALTDVEHNAALNSLTSIFAAVAPVKEVLRSLAGRRG